MKADIDELVAEILEAPLEVLVIGISIRISLFLSVTVLVLLFSLFSFRLLLARIFLAFVLSLELLL